ILEVQYLGVAYARMEVVSDVGVTVRRGELVVIIGANGSGKTTTLKTIAGLLAPRRGTIAFEGQDITRRPSHWIARHGIALVPEGRMVFPELTVLDNLRLGAYGRRDAEVGVDVERAFTRFPVLRDRKAQLAGTLSGGEQQMLAIARGLMARPRLLLLDDLSLPSLVVYRDVHPRSGGLHETIPCYRLHPRAAHRRRPADGPLQHRGTREDRVPGELGAIRSLHDRRSLRREAIP